MKTPVKLPSDRSFGFTIAIALSLLGGWLWWKASRWGLPLLGVAAAFALFATLLPRLLRPLNIAWMWFGALLNMIVSPVIMGLIFFLVFTPVSLFFRLTGRDALNRRFDRGMTSYWLNRTPPGPDGASLPRQF
jgi:Saxitoxin biosynthesis operon protein SxtJ